MSNVSMLHKRSHADADVRTRLVKARQIERTIRPSIDDLSAVDLLDIGTGSGVIASYFAKATRSLVSVDVVDERVLRDFAYEQIENEELPFPNGSFDIAVSNHVIEHVGDPLRHLREVRRVLRPNGFAYLATPNRFALLEPHYRLPLLSWLPPNLRSGYVRATRRGSAYDVQPFTMSAIRELARRAGARVEDRSIDVARERIRGLLGVDLRLAQAWAPALPSFVMLLRPVSSPASQIIDAEE